MTDENQIGTVVGRSLQEEMQTSYMEYAMSVIISRALPEVRDGLKPVQRRILYAMHRAGATAGILKMESSTGGFSSIFLNMIFCPGPSPPT